MAWKNILRWLGPTRFHRHLINKPGGTRTAVVVAYKDLFQCTQLDGLDNKLVALTKFKLIEMVRVPQHAFSRVSESAKDGDENIGIGTSAEFLARGNSNNVLDNLRELYVCMSVCVDSLGKAHT